MSSVFTVTNSTNNIGVFTFNVIGLDPLITYDSVSNHQYIFEIQTFNLLGPGGSSFIQMNYSLPNSN
jgi:hypothetical protein